MKILRILPLFALSLFLTACGPIGIIGGADGPTTMIIGGGEVKSPEAETPTDDATQDADAAQNASDAAKNAETQDASDSGNASGGSESADAATTDSGDAAQTSGPDGIIAPPPSEPPTPLTLALLSGAWAEAIKAELPAFEDGNHAVCSVLELSRDELHETLAQGGDGCDLIMVHSDNMPEFRKSGVLANLSALGYKPDSDIIPAVTEICTDGSAVTLAPWHANASVLLCNKQSLIASGSSTDRLQNLQNMLAACKAAKQRGEIGFAYHESFEDRVTLDFLPVLRAYDGWFLDRDGKPSIYTKKFQDAVNFFLDLTATGKSVPNADFVSTIDSGKALMGFIRSDQYTLSARRNATYISFPGAATRGGETHAAGTCNIWGFGVPAGSQNPELAERLLEYLLNPNIQRKALSARVTPCRYSLLQDPELQAQYPRYAKICEVLENSQYVPAVTEWPQMCDILGEELWKVMAGRKKVTECLEDAQSRITALLSQSSATSDAP